MFKGIHLEFEVVSPKIDFDVVDAFRPSPLDEHVPEAWCRGHLDNVPRLPTTHAELDAARATRERGARTS